MASRKSAVGKAGSWAWRRWIISGQQEIWVERLQSAGCVYHAFTEKPGGARDLLEAYVDSRSAATELARQWGGQVRAVKVHEWNKSRPAPPTRIGRRLEIVHEQPKTRKKSAVPQLHIPHGLAFGSGEHATTFMLLRLLAKRSDWDKVRVLDLGTGSGVLALATRLFGARKIVATDFDPDAVRTARQNEALNFSTPLIRWQRADVKRLRGKVRYDLVLANLFSGILTEAAPQIARSVAAGGELWLSGILVSQHEEVMAAYRAQGIAFIRVYRRGKWIMLQGQSPASHPAAAR